MPKPSWETSNNTAFFGYLKFLDFQASRGLDIHVTLQKDNRAHVSVYELGGKKIGGNVWLDKATYGLSLNFMDRYVLTSRVMGSGGSFPAVPGYKDYEEFFELEINKKAVELGIIAQKPGLVPNALPNVIPANNSAWPTL